MSTETKPKRYTYLLGDNEACTTAAKRLLILAKKKEKAMRGWVDEKIRETYIRVNNYCGCSFEYNWEQDL